MAGCRRVRSTVEVVAAAGPAGGTVLRRLHAEGALAVRRTGPATVHLVGTAAGPLNGDLVELRLLVGPGARLVVEGVAATLALPGRGEEPADWSLHAEVAEGGVLVCAPQPLVVSHRARLRTRTRVQVQDGGGLDLREQVVLGRHGEPGGDWTGRLQLDVGGRPVLRQTQDSALLGFRALQTRALQTRVLQTRVLAGTCAPELPVAATCGHAVACPLPGGHLLLTAFGEDLLGTGADLLGLASDVGEPRTVGG